MIGYNPMLPGGGYAEMGASSMPPGSPSLPGGWGSLGAGQRLGIPSAMPGMVGGPGSPGNPIPSAMPGMVNTTSTPPGGVLNFGNTTQPSNWNPGNPGDWQFSQYGGTMTRTDPGYGTQISDNAARIGMSQMEYDKLINPSTYGARYGIPDPGAKDWTPAPKNFEANYGTPAGNPYQDGLDASIASQATKWLTETALPSIQGQYVGTGGLGGSRQGVAQSGAIGQAHQNLTNALAQSRYGQYNQDQSRNLSRYQGDQGFFTQNRGLDQSEQRLGMDMYNLGTQGQWGPLNQFGNQLAPYTGNGTTVTNNSSGGGWAGALGGILGGATFGRNMNWW